jgi:hypothetical protein
MGTKAQVDGERANGHRYPNMINKSTLPLNAAKMLPKGGKIAHQSCVAALAIGVALAATKQIAQKRSRNETFCNANTVSYDVANASCLFGRIKICLAP